MNQERFDRASTFEQYLEGVVKNRELWHSVYDRVRLPEELVKQVAAVVVSDEAASGGAGDCEDLEEKQMLRGNYERLQAGGTDPRHPSRALPA